MPYPMHLDSAIWAFLGTLLGAAASIATSWFAARSAQRLDGSKADRDRREKFNQFQRETLLELFDQIHQYLRFHTQAHFQDEKAFRKSGSWGTEEIPEDVNEGLTTCRRRISILSHRLSKQDLRQQIAKLISITCESDSCKSAELAEQIMRESTELFAQLNEDLGSELRRSYWH